MEITTVEEFMVPVEEYATVTDDATLYDAVKALEKAHEKIDRKHCHYLHRAILVIGKNGRVLGKISQLDVLRALEPKYKEVGEIRYASRKGFNLNVDFMKSIMKKFDLCNKPFTDMCNQASDLKVTEFMHHPYEGEYVEVNTSLCEALHMFVMGNRQSLLVTKDDKIAGILRLTDIFKTVFQTMESNNPK